MNAIVRAITWPIVTLLVIGGSHLVAEAIRPELHEAVTPAVAGPIYLIVGGWGGLMAVRAGGMFIHGLGAGAILGLLPAMLQLVGFGLILGRDSAGVTTSALFGFVAMIWGSSLGAGIASAFGTDPVAVPTPRRDVPAPESRAVTPAT